jgi:hypothetical protein
MMFYPESGSSSLWNVGNYLKDYMASIFSLLWKPHLKILYQEQIRHKRPHRRNTRYTQKKKQNHGDIPKTTSDNKLKTNNIIMDSFYNI